MSTELGSFGRTAAFLVAACGFVTLVAAGQIAGFVQFRDAFTAAIPLVQIGVGAAALVVAWKLSHPRAWARSAAAGLLLVGLCGGGPWAGWLLWNGVFTALIFLAPLSALVGLVGVAVAWREVGRVAQVRAEAEAETERLMREAGVGTPPSSRALPILYGILAIPLALVAIAMFAPETWTWGEVRVRGILAGRSPLERVWVERAQAFPYSGSPLQWYLDYEKRWVSLDEDTVLKVADSIADEVAWRLAGATGTSDPVEGERRLWAAQDQELLPLWVADRLRARHVYYSPESLFSRSFDPSIHVVPDTVHLDCDQLVYVYLHVAWRLDLAMSAVPSPMHVYLRYGGPDGQAPLWVETTQFRRVDVDGNRVDFMGEGIGETFFIDEDYYPSGRGGTWATQEIASAAGYYAPWSDRDIQDAVVANVMAGVERAGVDAPITEELEAHLEGSREVTLVSNLYLRHVRAAQAALQDGKLDVARREAARAAELRTTHGALIIWRDAEEEQVLLAVSARGG